MRRRWRWRVDGGVRARRVRAATTRIRLRRRTAATTDDPGVGDRRQRSPWTSSTRRRRPRRSRAVADRASTSSSVRRTTSRPSSPPAAVSRCRPKVTTSATERRFVVLRDDASVEYVVTPDGTWVMPEGEEWRASDIDSTTANPLPALGRRDHRDGRVVGRNDRDVGGDRARHGARLRRRRRERRDRHADRRAIDSVRYDTTVQGLAASLLTRISPVTDDAPVVAPI